MLEMCSDIEDISFIDEDPEDEISDLMRDTEETAEDEVTEDGASVCDESSNIDKQQIVIKLNNEIELTSIVVNARPPSQGKEKNVEEDESQSPECRQNGEHGRVDYINQVDPTYDEISETSFNIGYEPLGLRAPIATSSSSSSETVMSGPGPGTAPGSAVTKRRSVLVRQSKLDTGDAEHPDMTRKRHSWVAPCHTSYKPSQV